MPLAKNLQKRIQLLVSHQEFAMRGISAFREQIRLKEQELDQLQHPINDQLKKRFLQLVIQYSEITQNLRIIYDAQILNKAWNISELGSRLQHDNINLAYYLDHPYLNSFTVDTDACWEKMHTLQTGYVYGIIAEREHASLKPINYLISSLLDIIALYRKNEESISLQTGETQEVGLARAALSRVIMQFYETSSSVYPLQRENVVIYDNGIGEELKSLRSRMGMVVDHLNSINTQISECIAQAQRTAGKEAKKRSSAVSSSLPGIADNRGGRFSIMVSNLLTPRWKRLPTSEAAAELYEITDTSNGNGSSSAVRKSSSK